MTHVRSLDAGDCARSDGRPGIPRVRWRWPGSGRRRENPPPGPRLCQGDRPLERTIDAQVLARFAEAYGQRPSAADAATQEFSALLSRRRQLIEMRVAEHNRLGARSTPHPTADA